MTLKEQIQNEFTLLAGLPAGYATLSVDTGAGRLESRLTGLDNIACAFEHFTLESPNLAGDTIEQLRKRAEKLSKQLSYLLEPIGTVEVDPDQCTVQMRSSPPQKDDDGATYYELLVQRGGRLSLCRYNKASGTARQTVPANVTREVFQRLAADFVIAAS